MNKKYNIYIDEAWRWPLAWPVFVWLVVPLAFFNNEDFFDSKILSPKKRHKLYNIIKEMENANQLVYWFWSACNKEIDKYWISKSIHLSICRWLIEIYKKLIVLFEKQININYNWFHLLTLLKIKWLLNKTNIDEIILTKLIDEFDSITKLNGIFIDGNSDFWLGKAIWKTITTIIDWDAKNKFISMASIIAKQERDLYMESLFKEYSDYSFIKHKWYWTSLHIWEIIKNWVCDIHRLSYLKKLMQKETINIDKYWNLNDLELIPKICKRNKTIKINKPSILIHICCVPDLTFPLKILKKYFKVYLIWYNPNIQDTNEHSLRYSQLNRLLEFANWDYILLDTQKESISFTDILYSNKNIIEDYNSLTKKDFISKIWKELEYGKRCEICYYFRLLKIAQIAGYHWIDYFTTTLSISPKKNLDIINEKWILAEKYANKSKFLFFDFRKNWWYIKSLKLSKKYWIYRQNYCGCNYSKKL